MKTMIEVKNRSEESWGQLAKFSDADFNQLVNCRRVASTKERIKNYLKKQKKLKTYMVSFKKEWYSEQFEIQAESDWDVGSAARAYFRENRDKIGFKEKERGKWAGDYEGYDTISYVKARS
jgi:hypothetical protein